MKLLHLSFIISIAASSFLNISASDNTNMNGFQKKIEVPLAASLPIGNSNCRTIV